MRVRDREPGMICMPGCVDMHRHLWTSVCRAMIQLDDPQRRFPVTKALGRHFTPEAAECAAGLRTRANRV